MRTRSRWYSSRGFTLPAETSRRPLSSEARASASSRGPSSSAALPRSSNQRRARSACSSGSSSINWWSLPVSSFRGPFCHNRTDRMQLVWSAEWGRQSCLQPPFQAAGVCANRALAGKPVARSKTPCRKHILPRGRTQTPAGASCVKARNEAFIAGTEPTEYCDRHNLIGDAGIGQSH